MDVKISELMFKQEKVSAWSQTIKQSLKRKK